MLQLRDDFAAASPRNKNGGFLLREGYLARFESLRFDKREKDKSEPGL